MSFVFFLENILLPIDYLNTFSFLFLFAAVGEITAKLGAMKVYSTNHPSYSLTETEYNVGYQHQYNFNCKDTIMFAHYTGYKIETCQSYCPVQLLCTSLTSKAHVDGFWGKLCIGAHSSETQMCSHLTQTGRIDQQWTCLVSFILELPLCLPSCGLYRSVHSALHFPSHQVL